VIFGVIGMGDPAPDTPETVASRIRGARAHPPPERLIPAPDCGMKYIPPISPSPSSGRSPKVPRSSAS